MTDTNNSTTTCAMTWDQVIAQVANYIDNRTKKVLIQSGHFSLLFEKNGKLVPAIKEDILDINLRKFIEESNYMGDFPYATFENSLSLATQCKQTGIEVKFVFIVNDWQWVKKGLYTFPIDRSEFFSKRSLPNSYNKLFSKYSFTDKDIFFSDSGIYFSEHKLRKEGKRKISLCSPSSCAVEYLPFLFKVLDNYDTLISYIPVSCKIPVLYAAIKYIQAREANINLFHIFYNPLTKEKEVSFINKNNIQDKDIEHINKQFHIMELLSK